MSLGDELRSDVAEMFSKQWKTTDGQKVPGPGDITLGANAATTIDGVVLYADLDESTALVERKKETFAAAVYKSFLRCAARIIRSEGGTITAYDGDRIMSVFVGEFKNSCAARSALKINYACKNIIQPELKKIYSKSDYVLRHTVAVDASKLFVAQAGIRGSNDLVWIGRAANHAAKMTTLPATYPSRITKEVFNAMIESVRTSKDGRAMWEKVTWNTTGRTIYRSTWWWSV